jgi:ABC-type sugar transport system ATPase subunit
LLEYAPDGTQPESSESAGSVEFVSDSLVQARGLTKRFGAVEAVRGIDLDVRAGEMFGFLGPNGAGKSSTMRMIGCVSPRSTGELQILGMDPDVEGPRIRARLGVVPQQDNLDNEFSVRDNLHLYGRYFGMSRSEVRAKTAQFAGIRAPHRSGHRSRRPAVRGDEATAHDRPVAGQRPGVAAP